jgi:putative ABC transport system permease protein
MIPLNYNWRSLMVRKATTIATALGIALVVFVLASSQMLANGIHNTMTRSGSAQKAIVLRKGSDAELSSSFEQRFTSLVLAAPGSKASAAGTPIGAGEIVLVIAMTKAGSADQVSNVQVRGVTDSVLQLRPEVRIVAGRPAKPGTDEVIIGQRLLGQFRGLQLGQRFEVKKNRSAVVVGAFEAGGSAFESEVWGDVDVLRTAFGREGQVSSVTVLLESPSKLEAFKAAIEGDKQLDLEVLRELDYFEQQSEGTAALVSFLGGAIVVFFSVGAMIGAMITMYGAVSNRQREVGTLRALGFSRLTILSSFLIESIVLALLGGLCGAVASLGMGFLKLNMMNQSTWSEMVFSFEPSVGIVLGSVIGGGLMGVFGGFLPAVRAARLSPIAAMRGE